MIGKTFLEKIAPGKLLPKNIFRRVIYWILIIWGGRGRGEEFLKSNRYSGLNKPGVQIPKKAYNV